MTPYEALLDEVRRRAVYDITHRWTGRRRRHRVICDQKAAVRHDAARCALDYLKTLRAVRIAAATNDWSARETVEALFSVVRS